MSWRRSKILDNYVLWGLPSKKRVHLNIFYHWKWHQSTDPAQTQLYSVSSTLKSPIFPDLACGLDLWWIAENMKTIFIWLLSALRAITKVQYKTDLQRKMLITRNRPGAARIVKRGLRSLVYIIKMSARRGFLTAWVNWYRFLPGSSTSL